ncbi:NUDIX domain-containing protein [Ferruginibacter sp. HRS2-29]|uniref:NUDIX hydrolase n=1 Tax=Ferruginibacter sp. HRS2-29 TaxID=2487334 RepID=UPI0020CF7365|nr:NUDIX domain-containing protein [Ferruginibacter sp. HRS2-29]MCP9749749.1 NUDIX hydrolase [Ferruginibacter sp. HRS2-29]
MQLKKLLEKKSAEAKRIYLPHISVDCVVFGFHGGMLKVLLTKLKDQELWGLPGGYMLKTENVHEAASRILKERTGAENIYLQEFGTFTSLNRSEGFFKDYPDSLWNKQRFISIGMFALVDYEDVTPITDDFSAACEWKDISDLPPFMMDHREITDKALLTLRKELNYKPIGYNLLPAEFTMPELQRLYETILNKKLNRGNFYRKMISYDILDQFEETRKGGAHRSPNLYCFNVKKYQQALKDGLKEGW